MPAEALINPRPSEPCWLEWSPRGDVIAVAWAPARGRVLAVIIHSAVHGHCLSMFNAGKHLQAFWTQQPLQPMFEWSPSGVAILAQQSQLPSQRASGHGTYGVNAVIQLDATLRRASQRGPAPHWVQGR